MDLLPESQDAFEVLRGELAAAHDGQENSELETIESDPLIEVAIAFVSSGQSDDAEAMAQIDDMFADAVDVSIPKLRDLTREVREVVRRRLAEREPAPLAKDAEFLKAAGARRASER